MQAGWAINAANAVADDANYERTMRLAEVSCPCLAVAAAHAVPLDLYPTSVQPFAPHACIHTRPGHLRPYTGGRPCQRCRRRTCL